MSRVSSELTSLQDGPYIHTTQRMLDFYLFPKTPYVKKANKSAVFIGACFSSLTPEKFIGSGMLMKSLIVID
jgi:hypothetical protein